MKKKILLTGGSGFIGRNALKILQDCYEVSAPNRKTLNVVDENNVDDYLQKNEFDILIHCASISPKTNPNDKMEDMLDFATRGLLNFEKYSDKFEKILYIGSGAEYNKAFDIKSVKEEDIGKTIPIDSYGYAKYILNKVARSSKNIYNLRIFGCYGPTDAQSKFIRDAIDCCIAEKNITIRQNCYFDYLYVEDLVKIMIWMIENKPHYHDYNVCNGKPIDLLSIAKIVKSQMNSGCDIEVFKSGLNKEYTADNSRLANELVNFEFTPIEDGIKKQIEWQIEYEKGKNYEKTCS